MELQPAIFVIFGITGDLANRYLLPALYHLADDQLLPQPFKIVGVTRRGTTIETVISNIKKAVENKGDKCRPGTLKSLAANTSIVKMDITELKDYIKLKQKLDVIEDALGVCLNRVFYLAIPSQVYAPIVSLLGRSKLNNGCQHGRAESRLLVEKPFGFDLTSAQELIAVTASSFSEQQIYRIDHYLAKETVQNILTFRSANPLFNSSWNHQHISHIIITAAEAIGIEGRVAFYEQMGALRDFVQSHLLQLLALITMKLPNKLNADSIHKAKVELLDRVKPPAENQMSSYTVRGQYQGYTKEVNNLDSKTETYAAVRLSIDNSTWQGVPVLIRTGKKLAAKLTEITLVFHGSTTTPSNQLTFRIQPNEGISLALTAKKPGYENQTQPVMMDFNYSRELPANHPDAYERVVVDALRGDKTLFTTSTGVLASWRIIEPILEAWQANLVPLNTYEAKTWGLLEADKLAHEAGIAWH